MMYMWIFAVAICTAFIIGYQCNMIRGNLKKLIPIGGMIALIDICCIMMFMVRNTIKISVVVLWLFFIGFMSDYMESGLCISRLYMATCMETVCKGMVYFNTDYYLFSDGVD